MVLDGALADAKFCGNIFIVVAPDDQRHDLALPRREIGEVIRGILAPGEQLVQYCLMLKDQLVYLTMQSLFSGESLSQPDFGQLAYVACARTALRASKYDVRKQVRAVSQMRNGQFNGHIVSISDVRHSENLLKLTSEPPSRIDPYQSCPIADIALTVQAVARLRLLEAKHILSGNRYGARDSRTQTAIDRWAVGSMA